jgi:hypothetical protein
MDQERLYEALRNADAAGDTASAQRLADYIRETQAQAPKKDVLSISQKIGMGMSDPFHGGAQFLHNVTPAPVRSAVNSANNWLADKTGLVAPVPAGGLDESVKNREQGYQDKRGSDGIDGWRMLGNVISPATFGAARAMPAGGSLLGKMGIGAGAGAGLAATSPVTGGDFQEQKTNQMLLGSTLGAATPVAVHGLARAFSPKASLNPDLKMLQDQGVRPSLGQAMGGGANALEQKMTSVPFVGDMIASRRAGAVEQFNTAAINKAIAPIKAKVSGSGTEAVRKAAEAVDDAYNSAKSQLGAFRVDQQAESQLANLRQMAKSGLEGRERQTVERYFKDYLGGKAFTADKFKEIDSKLTTDIARFAKGDAYQQKVGDFLKEVQRTITDNARRANPSAAQAFDAADKAYAGLVRIEGAAVGAKARDGVFTPGQLMTAVRQSDRSVRDRATAQGRALLQDVAGAGQRVLGNTVPDSGTPGRLLPIITGGSAVADPVLTGSGLGLLGALYSQPAQNLLVNAMSKRPDLAAPVANALRQYSTGLIPATTQMGFHLSE